MNAFDAALIGAGGFARNHMSILERLQNEQALRTVAVADPNIATIAPSANWKYQSGLRLYESLQQLLAEEECDLISIATPPFLHFDMVEAVLRHPRAFVYLEKPPVPLYTQLEGLLENPASERVAVGFQFLESHLIQDVKRRLLAGEIGEIRAIRASAATPRADSYYQRSSWAGRLTLGANAVFDGPASNGLAHLVHLIMFFGGADETAFALPDTITGRFLRARPIEAYDFAYLEGRLQQGPAFELAVCHCSEEHHPWIVRIEGTKGEIVFNQCSLESFNPAELLYQSYRGLLRVMTRESPRPRTRLQDCAGYLQAVCGAFAVSQGVTTMDARDIREVGEGTGRIYSVEKAARLVRAIAEGRESRAERWFEVPPSVNAASAARQENLLSQGG
jgi:predicted dehydrogenase